VDSLSLVDQLQPVSFIYNEGDGRTRYGFIAEDTATVDAHLTTYDASGTVSGIDDRSFIAILVGAIKDLYAKVQEYFARTEQLEERVSALEAQLSASAAAGAPSSGAASGAPDGPPASGGAADAGTATTTMSSDPALSTSAAWLTPPAAANDNQPVADEENEPHAQEDTPASEIVAEPVPAQENPLPEPANDNTQPPSAEAI
jgi:hypothetical protein